MSLQGVHVDPRSPTVHPTCAMAGITEDNTMWPRPEVITSQGTLAAVVIKTLVSSASTLMLHICDLPLSPSNHAS